MDDNQYEKVLAFDRKFTTNQMQIMKIFLTYLPASTQKQLAIYIKLMELQYTINISHSKSSLLFSSCQQEKEMDAWKLCDEILPLCGKQEQEKLQQLRSFYQNFESMQEMMQMVQMMQEMSPDTSQDSSESSKNQSFDFLSGLTGMDLSQFSEIFNNI